MNLDHVNSAFVQAKKTANPAEDFFNELFVTIRLARASVPPDKQVNIQCFGLDVRRYSARKGGMFIVEGLDQAGTYCLICAHFTTVQFVLSIVDKNEHAQVAPEVGFHTLFERATAARPEDETAHG